LLVSDTPSPWRAVDFFKLVLSDRYDREAHKIVVSLRMIYPLVMERLDNSQSDIGCVKDCCAHSLVDNEETQLVPDKYLAMSVPMAVFIVVDSSTPSY